MNKESSLTYNEVYNLIVDISLSITNIIWNVYGKIQEIQRFATVSNPTVNIKYTYDASGNRISKQVTNSSGNVVYTWYVRDAQSLFRLSGRNVMSTYTSTGTGSTLSSYTVDLSEQYLYGSSRLGILNRSVNMKTAYTKEDIVSFYRGYKQYELSNHLGNVWVTITDKKTGVSTNGTTVDNYKADVSTASDYYPFGMRMPGRTYTATGTKYKYGFNGKENDNEVKGEGNQQDYGMRIYDPRLGRFLSVDPLARDYPYYSPYHFAGNNPIRNLDMDGLEPLDFSWNWLNKMVSKGGKSDFGAISNDPVLGQIDVEAVYDKWTRQTWFVTKKQDRSYYWRHDPGADQHQRIVSNKPGGSNGQWVEFERQESRQARLNGELVDNLSMGIFNMTVGLATGGISSSGAFGASLLGKIGAGLTEDLIAQSLTTGFNYEKFNLTSLAADAGFAKFKYGLVPKNFTSSFGEYSLEKGFSMMSDNFSVKNSLITTGIGIALDATLDAGRNEPSLNMQQYTRFRNLSYKSKYATQFQSLDIGYKTKIGTYNASDRIGSGVSANVTGNLIGNQLNKEKE